MTKFNKAWVSLIPAIVAVASLLGLENVLTVEILTNTGEWVMAGIGILTSLGVYKVSNS